MPLEVDILDEVAFTASCSERVAFVMLRFTGSRVKEGEALFWVDITIFGLLDTTVGLEEAIPFTYLEGNTRPSWIYQ